MTTESPDSSSSPRWAPPPEPELDPIGIELWLKLLLSAAAVIFGVWLAGQKGFEQTARLALLQDHRATLNTLELIKTELESNRDQLHAALARLSEDDFNISVEISRGYFDAGRSKSYMSLLNQKHLIEIERLYQGALSRATAVFRGDRRFSSRDRDFVTPVFQRSVERIEKALLPNLSDQLELLERRISELGGQR